MEMGRLHCAVDGLFYTQRLSGIQRNAMELMRELDALVAPGEVELVLPENLPEGCAPPHCQNLGLVRWGKHTGMAWEQLDYPRYLKESGRRGLCLCNVIPLHGFRGDAAILDICYRARPDFYTDLRGRLSAAWHCLQYRAIAKKADTIITLTEFSKSELMRVYRVPAEKIAIIPSAWQHMERVQAADGVFDKWPALHPGAYYFSLANLLKNKNFPWVLRAAKSTPDAVFAIAGGGSLEQAAGELGLDALPNVQYLGYVSDGEAKTLMAHCKAFLFPTLYEGFGIPPMEAIACGAPRVLVSDTPCMREVYGENADYIDLASNAGDVEHVRPGHDAAAVLARYSWAESAQKLAALLRKNAEVV